MCYDLAFFTTIELVTKYLPELKSEYAKQMDLQFGPRDHFLAQAYPRLPIIINEDDELKLKAFEWAVIAPYMNTPEKIKINRPRMANARTEKFLDKTSYWYKIRHQRCIIPANGFYEHRAIKGMKTKVPYFIHRNDQPGVFIAGLYNYYTNPETQEKIGTFTVGMRPAGPMITAIHNDGDNAYRMPLQLENDMAIDWLKPGLSDMDIQGFIDFAMPDSRLEAWPVFSVRARNPRPDNKPKYEPFDYPGLPGLDEPAEIKTNTLF